MKKSQNKKIFFNMKNVCVVIVTHGDRFNFLQKTIQACLSNKVKRIVIVDNKSDIKSQKRLKLYLDACSKIIKIINLNWNTGSAGGFKAGIKKAINYKDCSHILLLDDDNVLSKNTIMVILNKFNNLALTHKKDAFLISCYRVCLNQLQHMKVKNGVFLGFCIKELTLKIFKTLFYKKTRNQINEFFNEKEIQTAPWGGLFFHKSLIKKYGLPREDFFLYSGDTEFTYRITNNYGKIFLIPEAKIIDIDLPMGGEKSSSNLLSYFNATGSKIYYHLRNSVFFEIHCKKDRTFIREINKFIYISILKILSLFQNKKERFNLIMQAINDGENNKLGYNPKFPL